MNNNKTMKLEAALAYVRRGWFVIPLCWPRADGKCGCPKQHMNEKEIGKGPLLGDDYQYLRPTEDDVRRWWTKWPQANIGILLGPSRLLVVDTDSEEAWREAKAKGLPPGPSVHTGKGRHFYYRSPEGLYGRTTKRGDARTIDVLASGYIVAPPSIHRSSRLDCRRKCRSRAPRGRSRHHASLPRQGRTAASRLPGQPHRLLFAHGDLRRA